MMTEDSGKNLPGPTAMTLDEILSAFEMHDQGIMELTPQRAEELAELLIDKVDKCRFVYERIEMVRDYFAGKRDFFAGLVKQVDQGHRAFKKRLAETMIGNSFERINGADWYLRLQHSQSTEVDRDPTAADHLSSPEFVRVETTYSWDITKIAEALKAGKDVPFARLSKNPYVRFWPNTKDAGKKLKPKKEKTDE